MSNLLESLDAVRVEITNEIVKALRAKNVVGDRVTPSVPLTIDPRGFNEGCRANVVAVGLDGEDGINIEISTLAPHPQDEIGAITDAEIGIEDVSTDDLMTLLEIVQDGVGKAKKTGLPTQDQADYRENGGPDSDFGK